jgi:hypothetical protein
LAEKLDWKGLRKRPWPNLRYYTSICLEELRRNAEVIIRVVNIRTEILTGEPPNTDRSVNALATCSVSLVNAPTNMLFPYTERNFKTS